MIHDTGSTWIAPEVRDLLRRISDESWRDTLFLEEMFIDMQGADLPVDEDDPE